MPAIVANHTTGVPTEAVSAAWASVVNDGGADARDIRDEDMRTPKQVESLLRGLLHRGDRGIRRREPVIE